MHLPDVSEFQPNVSWSAVKNVNGGAAIIRNLYGATLVDRLWAAGRRASARSAGVSVLGIYQYIRASQDITAQAQAFVAQVGRLQQGEFAIGDLEEGDGDQSGRAHAWLDYVNSHLPAYAGYQGAWLYSYVDYVQTHNLGAIFASPSIHTWIAAYQFNEPTIGHSLWQHSNGAVAKCVFEPWAGGAGFCDCSVFNGTLSDLKNRVYGSTSVTPPSKRYPEDDMNIPRSEFDRLGGDYPLALPTAATGVRFFSNAAAHLRVDVRDGSTPVEFDLGYDSAHNVIAPAGVNAFVVHRDDTGDTGTNDVSYAINY